MIMEDIFDNIHSNQSYSFESNSRVKAEFAMLVKSGVSLSLTSNIGAFPADYKYDVGMDVTINGINRNSEPMKFNEQINRNNSLDRPSPEYPRHMEHSDGFEFKYGRGDAVLNSARLDYVRMPNPVSSGPSLTNSAVLAFNTWYGVDKGSIDYDGVTYYEDQAFQTNGTVSVFTGSGTVCTISPIDFPKHLRERLAIQSTIILSGTVENYERRGNSTAARQES